MAQQFLIATVLSAHVLKRSGAAGDGRSASYPNAVVTGFFIQVRNYVVRLTSWLWKDPMVAPKGLVTLLPTIGSSSMLTVVHSTWGRGLPFLAPGGLPEHVHRRNIINMEKKTWEHAVDVR